MATINELTKQDSPNSTFYTIKELEKLSGIKAHTLRAWEKRYNIINPDRTETNIRRYGNDALKKILIIASLNNHGLKISKLANLSQTELQDTLNEIGVSKSKVEIFIDQLMVSMIEMDEKSFSNQLQELTNWFGFERMVKEIFFPFCDKLGVLWLINKIHPAHEHFITNIVRQKLFSEIDQLPIPESSDSKTVVLFLREGEFHDIGLIFYHYLLRKDGYRTIFLGSNLPFEDLKEVVQFHKADILVSALITKMSASDTQQWLDTLSTTFPNQKIVVSGHHLNQVNVRFPANVIHSPTAENIGQMARSGEL